MIDEGKEAATNVHQILTYLRCPRQVYYTNRGHEPMSGITTSYIEHMICKELAMAFPDIVKSSSSNDENLLTGLEAELLRVTEELTDIYPKELAGADEGMLEEAASAVHSNLEIIAENLKKAMLEFGDGLFLKCITPISTEPYLSSERMRMTGIPAKLVCIDDKKMPSLIKTGSMPENGVWSNDRIHIAAMAMLVEQEYEETVEEGIVEYVRHGAVRRVKIRANDRRQVLKIRNRVESIVDGTLPEKKESKLCAHCNFIDMCRTKSSLASKFF